MDVVYETRMFVACLPCMTNVVTVLFRRGRVCVGNTYVRQQSRRVHEHTRGVHVLVYGRIQE